MAETWAEAYYRIAIEVHRDMPDATDRDQYLEYRQRCEAWKAAHA